MLAELVALGVARRRTEDQFERDVRTGTTVRRADREHRPLPRAAFVLAMRVLAKAQTRHGSGKHVRTRHTVLQSCTTSGEPGMSRVAE